MNETIRITRPHRSIRSYTDEPVGNEILASGVASRPRNRAASGLDTTFIFRKPGQCGGFPSSISLRGR